MDSQPLEPGGNQNPFTTIPNSSATSHPTNSTALSNRPPQHRNVKPLFRISTTYSTITARAISFHGQLLTGITPHQLAQNGFYHQFRRGVGHTACCFTCETEVPLSDLQKHGGEVLPKAHEDDCLWQVICRDLNSFQKSTNNPIPATINSLSSNPSSSTIFLSPMPPHITVPEFNLQPIPQPTPPAPIHVECPTQNTDLPTEPPPANSNPKTQSPRPACSPQPRQPPTNPPTTSTQQPTYASVLQHPSTLRSTPKTNQPETHQPKTHQPKTHQPKTHQPKTHQPKTHQPKTHQPKTHQPARPRSILTIEDLHSRFHNKPSPFEVKKTEKKRPANKSRNKTATAVQSLSKFLNSALPAFSRYLVEIQSDTEDYCPFHPRTYHSCTAKAI